MLVNRITGEVAETEIEILKLVDDIKEIKKKIKRMDTDIKQWLAKSYKEKTEFDSFKVEKKTTSRTYYPYTTVREIIKDDDRFSLCTNVVMSKVKEVATPQELKEIEENKEVVQGNEVYKIIK